MEIFYSNNKDAYNINSICILSNGNLVSCNTNGIKIYCKKNDKYLLELNFPMDIEVKNAIEIKLNQIILFQANFVSGGFCSQSYHCTLTYSVSLYDIQYNKLYCLNVFDESVAFNNNEISFFKNNELLFVKYGQFKYDIYDINQNMKSLNQNNEIIEGEDIPEIDVEVTAELFALLRIAGECAPICKNIYKDLRVGLSGNDICSRRH